MSKKLLSLFMAFLFTFSLTVPVAAEGIDESGNGGYQEIVLFWSHTASLSNTLTINGSTATMKLYMAGYSTCKAISVTARLQRKVGSTWVTQASYPISTSSQYMSATRTASLTTKGEYRLYTTFKALNSSGGVIETIDRYSYANYNDVGYIGK